MKHLVGVVSSISGIETYNVSDSVSQWTLGALVQYVWRDGLG